jgi:putative transposase
LRIFGVGVVKTTTKEDLEMKKGRFTPEQIIGVLKQHEAGRKVQELAREIGVSEATIYTWKSKYGGMDVSEAQRLKSLEDENRRLKQLVADLSLDKEALKGIVRKNGWSFP